MPRRRHALDDSDTPTAVRNAFPPHRSLFRLTVLSVAFLSFAVAAGSVAFWMFDDQADREILTHPAYQIGLMLFFWTATAGLYSAWLRDQNDRRISQLEQLLRNWLVYKHEETRNIIQDTMKELLRDGAEIAHSAVAQTAEELQRMRAQMMAIHREHMEAALTLESVVPELLSSKDWQGFARALRDVAEGKIRIGDLQTGETDGSGHARLYAVPGGPEWATGRGVARVAKPPSGRS